MPVLRKEPFSHPDWLFELKWDGFRALAFIERGECRLVSKNGNAFKSFLSLSRVLPKEIRAKSAILDGEIVCLDKDGKSQFTDLMFHRGEPRFYAFDILQCDGQDQRFLQLVDRKQKLKTVMPRHGESLLHVDHLVRDGEILFSFAQTMDMEGIVAKRKHDPYLPDTESWFKIRNREYSQWAGREKYFERERDIHPDLYGWDGCAFAAGKPQITFP
jgi:bifunctional non-homologous end joining protein LigD